MSCSKKRNEHIPVGVLSVRSEWKQWFGVAGRGARPRTQHGPTVSANPNVSSSLAFTICLLIAGRWNKLDRLSQLWEAELDLGYRQQFSQHYPRTDPGPNAVPKQVRCTRACRFLKAKLPMDGTGTKEGARTVSI